MKKDNWRSEERWTREDSSIKKELAKQFYKEYDAWIDETSAMSSVNPRYENQHFINIVNMGENVIPFIIDLLKQRPDSIMNAIEYISGINPIKKEHYGNIKSITKDWIDWYENSQKRKY
jgi:hypothetical protein